MYKESQFFSNFFKFLTHFNKRKGSVPESFNLRRDGDAVFDYDFMMSLDEKDYPYYLSKAYFIKTGKKLNLHRPKTLNEKIQWLKIFDNNPQKRELTDKVLVRDYVREKIGDEYLKPVLWIGDKFDDIPFDSLPVSFIVKTNHGCKWHFIVKNKNAVLANKQLFNYIRTHIENWLKLSFFGFSDFETQYINIKPRIIIEPLMREDLNSNSKGLCVWCVNSDTFVDTDEDEFKQTAVNLSKILADNFKFVRVDWMIYKNKLYFEEMTFTPFSGYLPEYYMEKDIYKQISKNLCIK